MPSEDAYDEELPTILIVDDDEVSLAIISMLLTAEGYSVLRAAGGDEALKEAAQQRADNEPSVVLADLQMPGLCGRELALAMRTLLPRAVLIAMSATPDAANGYDGFIGKPLDTEALRRLIVQIDGATADSEASATDDPDLPVLDERIFHKLQRMMPATALADIYRVCISDVRRRAAEIPQLAERDGDELQLVRQSAHAIKGGAGMVGAALLANTAARMERGSYRKDDIPDLVSKLLGNCNQLQSILVTKVKGY
jgi:CheY-like chemotaxis protein